MPQPRPALRRAPDADIPPALVIPLQGGGRPRVVADTPAVVADAPASANGKKPTGKKSKKAAKAKKAAAKAKKDTRRAADKAKAASAQRFRGAGRATSDALLFNSTKRVPLKVQVPKSVRDEIRGVARMSGASEDDLVSEILTAWLSEPRRW